MPASSTQSFTYSACRVSDEANQVSYLTGMHQGKERERTLQANQETLSSIHLEDNADTLALIW